MHLLIASSPFRRLVVAAAVGFCVVSATAFAASATVILRVPPGTPLPPELASHLTQWRQSGQIAGVFLLTQGRSEKPERTAKFEALAVLEFASEKSCEIWLREPSPAIPAGLIARRADVLAQAGAPARDRGRAVFIVNTYTPIVPAARFTEFVRGYVQPLYAAMHVTGHLARYTAYLERGEVGKVDALNVLEYRDAAGFDAIVAAKTKLRDEVAAAVPTYNSFDKIKDTVRLDGFGTTATYTELPRPAGAP